MSPSGLEQDQSLAQPFHDGTALVRTHRLTQSRPSPGLAQLRFNPVEMLDLSHHPARAPRCLLQCVVELAPGMRPATREFDAIVAVGMRAVGAIAIALEHALELRPHHPKQTVRAPARLPVVEDIFAWPA